MPGDTITAEPVATKAFAVFGHPSGIPNCAVSTEKLMHNSTTGPRHGRRRWREFTNGRVPTILRSQTGSGKWGLALTV